MKHLNTSIKPLCALIFILFAGQAWGYGDYQTLEIIAPKAAGSGSPAIPATHRCFYAYPGITYTFKAQVIGGTFPYLFVLSDAPSGMTVDEHTGVITWTNPTTTASDITVTVYDKDGHSTNATWTVTVGTSGWYFVDADTEVAEGSQTGAIDAPFNTVDDVMAVNDEDGRVIWRAGTYTINTYHSNYSSWNYTCNFSYNATPHIWMAYPGDTPVFADGQILQCNEQTTPYYFYGLKFTGATEHVWTPESACDYFTVDSCEMDGLTTSRTGNSNQGGLFTRWNGPGYYLCIQGSSFHDYIGVAGVGSFYGQRKMLIEGNTFYNQATGSTGICTAIASKTDLVNCTFRGNNISITAGTALGNSVNGMFNNERGTISTDNEVCFNRLSCTGTSTRYNNNGNQEDLWSYRNTYVGTVQIQNLASGSCEGPWSFDGDIFQNAAQGITSSYAACITLGTNLTGTTGLVDASGLLINRDNVGTYGWEVADSEYWGLGEDTTAPTIVSIIVSASGTTATVNISEIVEVANSTGFSASFSVQGATAMTYASGSGTASLVFNLDKTVQDGETGTLAYTTTTNGIEDAAGNDLESVESQAITNNSEQLPDATAPNVYILTEEHITSSNSTTFTWTDSDAVGVTARKWRIGAAPDATHGTACDSSTSTVVTGLSAGANTVYIGAADAAGNWGSSSVIITYTASPLYVTQSGSGDADGSSYANSMSVATHNAATFTGDDTIYLCDTITSSVIVPSSGAEGHPIVYRGDYADHPCTIDGRRIVSSWTDDGGGKYHAATSEAAYLLVEDDIILSKSTDATLTDGNWFYASNVIYYKPTSGVPGDHVVGWSVSNGIVPANRQYITIKNVSFKYAGLGGIRSLCSTENNDNITVDGCTFDYCRVGIVFRASTSGTNSNIAIKNCTMSRCASAIGVYTLASSGDISAAINTAFTIEYNTFNYIGYANGTTSWDTVIRATPDKECIGTQNLQDSIIRGNLGLNGYQNRGIILYVRQDGTVSGNTVFGNGMFNLGGYPYHAGGNLLGADVSNNAFCGNVSYECGITDPTSKYGAYLGDITTPTGEYNYFYNNVICGGLGGIYLKDYWKVKNNTITDWDASSYAIAATAAHSHTESDYNCIYPATGNIAYDSEARTLEAWQGLGYDTHSVTGDPRFYNPALHDFRVHSDGAGVEKGTDLGETYQRDYYGHWQGDNGAAWDIGTIWFDHKPTIQ